MSIIFFDCFVMFRLFIDGNDVDENVSYKCSIYVVRVENVYVFCIEG